MGKIFDMLVSDAVKDKEIKVPKKFKKDLISKINGFSESDYIELYIERMDKLCHDFSDNLANCNDEKFKKFCEENRATISENFYYQIEQQIVDNGNKGWDNFSLIS